MSLTLLSLRTKLSTIGLKWSGLPSIDDFTQYIDFIKTDTMCKLNSVDTCNCKIVGYLEQKFPKYSPYPSPHKLCNTNIYILTDGLDYIYISLGLSHPVLWYSIAIDDNILSIINIQLIRHILNQYDVKDKIEYSGVDYILVGNTHTISESIGEVGLGLLKSGLMEVFTWGSQYKLYPYDRETVYSLSSKEKINIITDSLKQKANDYTICYRTIYSKSQIKIYQYGDFINIQIRYNPVKIEHPIVNILNENQNCYYPQNLPLDVVMLLSKHRYINYKHVIDTYNNDSDSINEISTILKAVIPNDELDMYIESIVSQCIDGDKILKIKHKCINN
jgi:hypothetical protein